MKTTTNYKNEALMRLAKYFLTKNGASINTFFSVSTMSGDQITLQGWFNENGEISNLLGLKYIDEITENHVIYKAGKHLRFVLSINE